MGYFQQMAAIGKSSVGVKMEAASKTPSASLKGKGNQQVSRTSIPSMCSECFANFWLLDGYKLYKLCCWGAVAFQLLPDSKLIHFLEWVGFVFMLCFLYCLFLYRHRPELKQKADVITYMDCMKQTFCSKLKHKGSHQEIKLNLNKIITWSLIKFYLVYFTFLQVVGGRKKNGLELKAYLSHHRSPEEMNFQVTKAVRSVWLRRVSVGGWILPPGRDLGSNPNRCKTQMVRSAVNWIVPTKSTVVMSLRKLLTSTASF